MSLRREAEIFSKYLVGEVAPERFLSRYEAAHEKISFSSATKLDRQILGLVTKVSLLLPFLDAACGVSMPGALIRRKLLLMAAILEASPRYAPYFLPESQSFPRLMLSLFRLGVFTGLKLIIGVPILFLMRQRA